MFLVPAVQSGLAVGRQAGTRPGVAERVPLPQRLAGRPLHRKAGPDGDRARCVVADERLPLDAVQVQLGEAPQLLEVGESGEFKRGTLGESKESYKVKTYGRVVAITRQTLINDDLDAFTRIPAMYGNSIAQLESDVVWSIITANPAMADGNALFHTTHKNLAGTGTALDVSSVGAARARLLCIGKARSGGPVARGGGDGADAPAAGVFRPGGTAAARGRGQRV